MNGNKCLTFVLYCMIEASVVVTLIQSLFISLLITQSMQLLWPNVYFPVLRYIDIQTPLICYTCYTCFNCLSIYIQYMPVNQTARANHTLCCWAYYSIFFILNNMISDYHWSTVRIRIVVPLCKNVLNIVWGCWGYKPFHVIVIRTVALKDLRQGSGFNQRLKLFSSGPSVIHTGERRGKYPVLSIIDQATTTSFFRL